MTFSERLAKAEMIRRQCARLIGLDLLTASIACDRAGVKWRVVVRDGVAQMKTNDSRMDRVNFVVERGHILSVGVG